MALNFPLNPSDGTPYNDPVSGLKYIFNSQIGGWETAIQPPCIVTDGTPPDISIDGFLWFNASNQKLFVKRGGTWTSPEGGGGGGGGASVTVSGTPPAGVDSSQGDLWWDNVGGTLYIYYQDATSNQWVIASPNVGGETSTNVFIGSSAPPDPAEGSAWYNTVDGVLYIYTPTGWKPTNSQVSGVNSVTGIAPIVVTNNNTDPVVSVSNANEVAFGVTRYATQAETDNITDGNIALSPKKLASGIDGYLPGASTTQRGVVRFATQSQTDAGTNTTRAVTPAGLQNKINASGNPVGTVIAYAGETAPTGYLVCDGSLIQDSASQEIQGVTADFTNLRTVLGTAFSSNDVDVLLPDLRGEFIRGYSAGRTGVDPGRAFGSNQAQAIEAHDHSGASGNASTSGGSNGGGNRSSDSGVYTTNATGGSETRPRNVALLYCIKY